MMYIMKMAWRNISRNRRRSALSIIAIGLAVFLIVMMRSLVIGNVMFFYYLFNV